MDDLVEWGFHALRAFLRVTLQIFFEVLLEHLISPLAKLIAAIFRLIRALFRVLLRFDVVANPLAALATIAVLAGPFFILGKALEWFLTS